MVIIMLPKTRRLLVAYSLLAAASVAILAHDNSARRKVPAARSVPRPPDSFPAVPLPITRLADSPFLKTAANAPGSDFETEPEPIAVVFLKVAVQAQTRDGSIHFAPGTQVRLLQSLGGRMKVTRDGADFVVEDWQITDDPKTAARLARSAS